MLVSVVENTARLMAGGHCTQAAHVFRQRGQGVVQHQRAQLADLRHLQAFALHAPGETQDAGTLVIHYHFPFGTPSMFRS